MDELTLIAYVSRNDDDDDAVAKMAATEEALEAKEKVISLFPFPFPTVVAIKLDTFNFVIYLS